MYMEASKYVRINIPDVVMVTMATGETPQSADFTKTKKWMSDWGSFVLLHRAKLYPIFSQNLMCDSSQKISLSIYHNTRRYIRKIIFFNVNALFCS